MIDLLRSLGLVVDGAIEELQASVRDRDDVGVLRCRQSGIIFLSKTDHIDREHYEEKEARDSTIRTRDGRTAVSELDDDERRIRVFGPEIEGKRWLDFGAGSGRNLRLLGSLAQNAVGIEPNRKQREAYSGIGHEIHGSMADLGDEVFDVITLFHVFEHLTEPIEILTVLRHRLADKGRLIILVPHARDLLITTLACEAFRRFTFWSEHLILHTQESLGVFIKAAEFDGVRIKGYQRYPLSNHLYWLRHGQPGGHKHWDFLNHDAQHAAYEQLLQSIDRTDSLIAVAEK